MLHKTSGKIARQARQASFAGKDFHKTMCHRQTKWRSRTLPRLLASGHRSSNSKPDHRGGLARYNLFQGTYLSGEPAIYRSQARQANTHLDLGCIGQEPFRSGAAKPLQGLLPSRRDKILLGHSVCRSSNNLHRQNWLAGPGPTFFRKFCPAWAMWSILKKS